MVISGNNGDRIDNYKLLFSKMINAFALRKIILDIDNIPIDYEFVEVNSSFESMMSLNREDILGKRGSIVHPGLNKDTIDWIKIYGDVALTGVDINFEAYSTMLNKWLKVIAYSTSDYNVATLFEDITDVKINEETKITAQLMHQRIIDILPIRIFWKDMDLTFLGCNQALAHDAGVTSPAGIIGKNDFDMAWKDQAKLYQEDDRKVINSGISKLDYDEQQTTPNGDKIWLKTSKVPLTDMKGNTIGILGTYEDITSTKKIEDDLKLSQEKLKAKLKEVESFNRFAVDRELKMVELKSQIHEQNNK